VIHGSFEKQQRNGVIYYAVSFLEQTGLVRAVFTTRTGGVSTGETATMNLSTARRDTLGNVRENYRRVCCATGFEADRLVVSRQVHRTAVHEVTDGEIGRGIFDDYENIEADGLMTNRRGVALVKHSADCVPVYIVDTGTPAIAMVHAGWRGTVEGIAAEAVRRMAEVYGTKPQDCFAAVGPSIGPCCFEVSPEVAEQFDSRYPGWELVTHGAGNPKVDLWRCNALQLLRSGIPDGQIAVSSLCTACDTGTFYSHRREQGKTGVMAAFLELRRDCVAEH
jgi:polyphenol oxidase